MLTKHSNHILLVFTLVMALLLCTSVGLSAAGNDNDFTKFTSYSDKDICIATVKDLGIKDGETMIKTGEAISQDDIIIFNDKIAIGIACGTNDPWGYPAGSVLDVANITVTGQGATETLKKAYSDGKITTDYDRVWDIQFLMNNWDSWAPSNAGKVTYEVIRYDFDTNSEYALTSEFGIPALKLQKSYTVKGDFTVTTYYSMEAGKDRAYMRTKVVNNGAAMTEALSSGYSLTHEGDFNDCTFSAGKIQLTDQKKYNVYTSAYTEETCCTLAAPNSLTKCGTSETSGYQDLINTKTYAAEETAYFDGYILMDKQGDTSNVIQFLMEEYDEADNSVTIKGTTNVEYPAVTIKKTYADASTTKLCWVRGEKDGSYEIQVPALNTNESYSIIVEKDGYSPKTPETQITSEDFTAKSYTFTKVELEKKVKVTFNIKDQFGEELWSKVCISGVNPSVRYTGESVFLGQEAGVVVAEVPQGEYTAVVYGQGANFYGKPQEITGNSSTATKDITITQTADLADGWVSADVHHHTCKNDGYSTPQDVMLSQLISGLQVGVVSDHDFVSENQTAYDYIEEQDLDMAFYPSVEISCSWAHYNVLPQTSEAYDKLLTGSVHFDQFADYNDIVDSVHELGATITQNHPYISYGLAYAYKYGVVPGRYDSNGDLNTDFDYDAYDTIELNGAVTAYGSKVEAYYNTPVINDTMNDWSMYLEGTLDKAHYLVGGSDVHDVLANSTFMTGISRTVAYIGDKAYDLKDRKTVGLAFTEAANAGHSYVTSGPLINSDKIYGNEYTTDYKFSFTTEIDAVNGISKIEVYTNKLGASFAGVTEDTRFDFDNAYEVEDVVTLTGKEKDSYTYTFTSNELKDGENYWFAIKVTDTKGRYAISNPFWVHVSEKLTAFEDAVFSLPEIGDLTLEDTELVENATKAYKALSKDDLEWVDEYDINYYEMALDVMKGLNDIANFKDVDKDTWYTQSVAYSIATEIFKGTSTTTFNPNDNITRAMFVTVLYRFAGEPAVNGTSVFTDVSATAYYANAVKWAYDNKITFGETTTTFAPDKFITREQLVSFLYRYADNEGYIENDEYADLESFDDYKDISAYAKDAMEWAVSIGLVNGRTETKLVPLGYATRAETATLFFRAARMITLGY